MQSWQGEIVENEVCSDQRSIVPASKEAGKVERHSKYRLINLI